MALVRCWPAALLAALFGCGQVSPSPEAELGLDVAAPAGWEIYHQGPSIVRLRRKSGEADLDISAHALGPGGPYGDIDALFARHAQEGTQKLEGEREVAIDGVKARRVAFTGKRADSGAPVARVVHVLERDSKGYVFLFLAAGEAIEEARAEADALVGRVRFRR